MYRGCRSYGAIFYLIIFMLLLGSITTTKAQQYTITDLGTLGGEVSIAYRISNFGEVVGYSLTNGEDYNTRRAFLYKDGVMLNLGTLGGSTSCAHGINNLGQVVGESDTALNPDDYQAFLYTGGNLGMLYSFSGHSMAADINDKGQAVGHQVQVFGRAFLYDNGFSTDLGTLGGETSLAAAINNAGQVVGESTISSYGEGHAFLYSDGVMQDLGTLGGTPPYPGSSASSARDINDLGEIVGSALTIDGASHAFLHRGGSMIDLGTLGGTQSGAYGINNYGEVVGHSQRGPDNSYYAFLYRKGSMIDLNNLLTAGSGWDYDGLSAAFGINDKGQIVGWGRISGQSHAFLLTPIPIQVTINIRPEGDANRINLRSNGKIAVAIISTPDFDAPSQVDQGSLTFGATGDEQSLISCKRRPKDVHHDGFADDLVCRFYIQSAGFKCGDTEGILKGLTKDGKLIEGRDFVNIVKCK